MLILITWVSWSGKTTLQNHCLEKGMTTLYNYVTRSPREDSEIDSYIFLTEEQFEFKKANGELAEHVHYDNHYYWMSRRTLTGKDLVNEVKDVVAIVTPDWREQLLELCKTEGIECRTFFLGISETIQEERILKRGGDMELVRRRKSDFDEFFYTEDCLVLDGTENTEVLYTKIMNDEKI